MMDCMHAFLGCDTRGSTIQIQTDRYTQLFLDTDMHVYETSVDIDINRALTYVEIM